MYRKRPGGKQDREKYLPCAGPTTAQKLINREGKKREVPNDKRRKNL